MDHPELFWVHNRKQVYKTTFSNANYCMFSPGYSYTDEEIQEIQAAADNACQEVSALVSEGADDYEKAKAVYTYLIDTAEYQESEDDQSMAGIFWRRQAVCAGYAGVCPVSAGISWSALYLRGRQYCRKYRGTCLEYYHFEWK